VLIEKRLWGNFIVLYDYLTADRQEVKIKLLNVDSGKNLSYQKHFKRSEVWTVTDGRGILVLEEDFIPISAGDVLLIPQGAWHSLYALTNMRIVETQMGDKCEEEDIERLFTDWSSIVEAFGDAEGEMRFD